MNDNIKELAAQVIRYGEIKADYQIGRIKGYAINQAGDFQRIRVIRYDNKVYVHYMVDGEFIDCYEV